MPEMGYFTLINYVNKQRNHYLWAIQGILTKVEYVLCGTHEIKGSLRYHSAGFEFVYKIQAVKVNDLRSFTLK